MTCAHRERLSSRAAARGFSLVEIMVAVVVICVGLLGIAKMQALAVSSTTIARQRSLAAFEAASLASAMHSNRVYWASAAAAAASPITITSATATITPATLAAVPGNACFGDNSANPKCPGIAGAQTLAGFDLTRWSATLGTMLPNAVTTINCPGAVQPPSCIIQMTWTEQAGMLNNGQQTNTGQFETPTYTLYVEP